MPPVETLELTKVSDVEDVLSYVEQLALEVCPDFNINLQGNPINCGTQAVYKFVDRYNQKKIYYGLNYDDYVADKIIQDTLQALGVNIDQFWYLLLFIRDYAYNGSYDGLHLNDSPKEELEKMLQKIQSNLIDADTPYPSFNKPMSLDIKIKGEHSLLIQNPTTITLIARLLEQATTTVGNRKNILDYSSGFGNSSGSETYAIWIFAKMFITFFKLNPSFKGKKKKNDPVSTNKNLLISRLAYFTKLTKNEDYYDDDDSIKKVIKSFKDKKTKIINNIY